MSVDQSNIPTDDQHPVFVRLWHPRAKHAD
jgi:hypothetical protein